MIKNIFIFGAIILLASLIGASFIFAEKSTPEETVRRYWQHLLNKNCEKMVEMQTRLLDYRRDANGQIYEVRVETKQVGAEKADNSPSCFLEEHVEAFVSKKDFKIVKSKIDEELRLAHVLISTKDHNKLERKFEFSLSKDSKDDTWKIIGFNMLIDEKER